MKIAQYYDNGKIKVGMIDNGMLAPVDFQGDMIELIEIGEGLNKCGNPLAVEDVKFAPAVTRPEKIIALMFNYPSHFSESKWKRHIPEYPLIFAKFPNTLNSHRGLITWNTDLTDKVDFEGELAVIIGRKIHECPEESAMDAIFGYTCANDVSARNIQFMDNQIVRGKSPDTFCPLGPWIVTADEAPDPHALNLKTILNGEVVQESNTGEMLFRIPELISFLSMTFTLMPGDVILTGTPHGVGCFRDPPLYMKDGDEIVVEIEGIGRLENKCKTRHKG
ncbi:MAG: fumarylacetoacetate hydrolase family protein [Deltaproteobacteria bacterium]|nr:fumarylacetoacetate hydrolase family protein [Deltaproteobacteria bacterium]